MSSKAGQQIDLGASAPCGPSFAEVMLPGAVNLPLGYEGLKMLLDQPASRPYAGPKRRRASSELAGSSATWDRPTAKKLRIKKTVPSRFPGAHVEVWHKDLDMTPVMAASARADVHLHLSARQSGVRPVSSDLPVLEGSLAPVHNPFNSAGTGSSGDRWPLSSTDRVLELQPFEAPSQDAQDLVPQAVTGITGIDLSLLNCQPAQWSTAHHAHSYPTLPAALTGKTMPDLSSSSPKTMPSPWTWTNTTPDPVFMIDRSGMTWPLLKDAFDYSKNFPSLISGSRALLGPLISTGTYKTKAMPEDLTRGSRDVYTVPQELLASSLTYTEGDTEHILPYRLPHAQESFLDPVSIPQDMATTNFPWRDSFPPTNRMLPWRLSHESRPPPNNGLDQGAFKSDLPEIPPSFTAARDTSSCTAVTEEEEVLRVYEDSQAPADCTCHTQTHEDPCPAAGNGTKSWVMVAYKLAKPIAKPEKKPRKPRSRLDEGALVRTKQTRDTGACIRCKIQRVRCMPDPANPAGPCQACSRVTDNLSRKVIHHIPCHRFKLREVVLFRTSASNVTNRWHGDQVRHVKTSSRKVKVHMMQDFVGYPFAFDVCAVARTRRDGYHDKTTRDWYDGAAVISEPVSAYALADVQQTMAQYKAYIRDSVLGVNCTPSMENMATGFWDAAHDTGVVGDIYAKAWEYFCSLPRADETWEFFYQRQAVLGGIESSRSISDTAFLLGLFELQFALRHATGWSWILDGAIPDAARIQRFPPLRGRVSTPRLVVGQIDAIRISSVLKPLAKSILRVLTAWISDRQYGRWLTIFFSVFILLAEIGKATEDAYHHGWYDKDIRGNGPKNAHVIKDLHETANIILAHWHYYNCSIDLTLLAQKGEKYKNLYGKNLNQGWWEKWCHPMYFADQMVDVEWTARQAFT